MNTYLVNDLEAVLRLEHLVAAGIASDTCIVAEDIKWAPCGQPALGKRLDRR